MAQELSDRACDRCRERRVKCDKRQPMCLRCEKLGKPCPGYDKKRKFVDEGITLRRKYQATNDHPARGEQAVFAIQHDNPEADVLASASPADATPSRGNNETRTSSTLVQPLTPTVPSNLGMSNQSMVGADLRSALSNDASLSRLSTVAIDPTTEAMLLGEGSIQIPLNETDPMLDDIWKNQTFDPEFFDLEPEVYYNETGNTCGFLPNIPEIVDEVDQSDILLNHSASATPLSTGWGSSGLFSADDSNLWAPESQLKTSAQITHERDHEMAYLIRHFAEFLGPWMDLFDRDKHFTQLVPLKALRDALLRNAIAAVAAKQLGRVKGQQPHRKQSQRPSAMEVLDEAAEIDWFYKAANYYDKAIAFSRQYLQAVTGSLNSKPHSPNSQTQGSMANSDDLLLAVSIFSLYEWLDNLDTGWLQHLSGLKSLFIAVSPDQQIQNQITPSLTGGRLASFWNFARADYQAAYINHQHTLLDTEDIALWNNCGLEVQLDGSLYKSTDYIRNDPVYCGILAELVAHTLLWLVLRVTNYLASDEASSVRQGQWDLLTRQLDHWYGNLPATYQPCAQIRHRNQGSASKLTESFFSIDVCAAALQLYHFARILLLLHRPVSNDSRNRLKQYREVSNEAIRHAHEIIGIALGRPQPAIRVEMLLPLSIAGACLEENEERKIVIELLKAIEEDTGCSTETRCRELVQEWGWAPDPEGIT